MFFPNQRQHYAQARPHLLAALGLEGRQCASRFLSFCPHAEPTSLLSLPFLATSLGVGSIMVKDEGTRLGLGSFKALGGAYAVLSLVLARAEQQLGKRLNPADLVLEAVREVASQMTVTCATDGNHGRSVAAGARIAGCRCVIYVHAGVSVERADAIARYGADVRRTIGTYDDSVRDATTAAASENWTVVSDTSWQGYEEISLTVMQGYTIMAGEAFDALAEPPTHLFLQAGVGGMAAAVAAHALAVYGADSPQVVIVEPTRAACLMASAKAGHCVEVPHGEPTVMAMLECYTPSAIAWEILSPQVRAYVTLEEDEAIAVMKQLAFPLGNDPVIVAGESGGTGLAGLLACKRNSAASAFLALDNKSRVLVFNTEGATDPELYQLLLGGTRESN